MRPDPLRRSFELLLLAVTALVLTIVNRADPDLWGHVRYGQDVLAAGRLPATATYTFTAPDHPWINHENLSEIAFAAAVDLGGVRALMALRCLLGLVLFAVVIASNRRRGASAGATALVVLAAAFNLAPWWSVRPQLFTIVLFAVVIAILDRSFGDDPAGGARPLRALWSLPLLFAVWANAHGGFLAGYAVLVLYLGCRAIAVVRRGQGRGIAPHAAIVAACGLATIANPYGPRLLTWLAWDLAPPRPEITEWAPLSPSDPLFPAFIVLVAITAAAWLGSTRRRNAAEAAVLLATAWQAFAHERHAPFFAVLAAFWVPIHLDALGARLGRTASPGVRPLRRVAATRVAMLAAASLVAVVAGMRSRFLDVAKEAYPVEAVEFMADRGLVGRMVVYFDWAQYALAAFAPPATVAFDGRFRTAYPEDVAEMHFDFIIGDDPVKRWRSPGSPPFDPARVLEVGEPDLVLLSRVAAPAVELMKGRADWVLLYQDGLAQLWGRRRRYDDPASAHYLPAEERSISDRPQAGVVPWPALPAGVRRAGG
jgi:hypothetical protein